MDTIKIENWDQIGASSGMLRWLGFARDFIDEEGNFNAAVFRMVYPQYAERTVQFINMHNYYAKEPRGGKYEKNF